MSECRLKDYNASKYECKGRCRYSGSGCLVYFVAFLCFGTALQTCNNGEEHRKIMKRLTAIEEALKP